MSHIFHRGSVVQTPAHTHHPVPDASGLMS